MFLIDIILILIVTTVHSIALILGKRFGNVGFAPISYMDNRL